MLWHLYKLTNFISEVAVTVHKGSQEELPRAQGQGQRPRGATPRLRSGATAVKRDPMSKVRQTQVRC